MMEERELYQISTFRLFSVVASLMVIVAVLFSLIPDYLDNIRNSLIWKLSLIVVVLLTSILLFGKYTIEDLPTELNNLVAFAIFGIAIYAILLVALPLIVSLVFGMFYSIYFISKMDENNKILFNRTYN